MEKIKEDNLQPAPQQSTEKGFWKKSKLPLYFAVFFVLLTVAVTSVLVLSLKQENNLDVSPAKEPVNKPLTLHYSGDDKILPGETIELSWQHREGLDYYSNEILLCLIGYDSKSKAIPAKGEFNEQLCTYPSGSLGGSYLIAKANLNEGNYKWTVPDTIQESYVETPEAYIIRALVFDNRPEETHEWGGCVGSDEIFDLQITKKTR